MNQRWLWLSVSLVVLIFALTACEEPIPVPTSPPPAGTIAPPVAKTAPPAASPVNPTATPPASSAPVTASPQAALTCPPATPLAANTPLAARVNGQGIPLDFYNRQVTQAQAAMIQQGLDPKSAGGQEALKSLKQQVLDQLINDIVIAQHAEKEGVRVSDNDLNARLAQMIQDAGSVEKLNEYLQKNQLSLGDLCSQVRAHLLGEAMLNRVTAALPTQVEQVRVRHILVANAALAQQLRNELRAGKDFAALARQYSLDEASKANGGDLGWMPKGVLDPQFEAVAFQLPVGQISDVVQTQFGYHLLKVDARENARALPPELIQNARQQAFLAWLQAVRQTMQIERLVQP